MKIRRPLAGLLLAAFALTTTAAFTTTDAFAQTATVSPTPTATPTPAKPLLRSERRKERDGNNQARPDTAAPRFLTLVADHGSALDNAVTRVLAGNSYRIRGMTASAVAVGTECTLTISVAGKVVIAPSLVGLAGKATYFTVDPPVDVPPGAEVTLLTEVTGTNTGLFVALDTIP